MAVVPQYHALAVRVPLMLAAVLLNGVATGLYITARYGPGPRDGLMTGLHRRTGRSLRLLRTGIELTVLAAGFVLGGGVGVGTVLYAVAIGPLAQFFLRVFAPSSETGTRRAPWPVLRRFAGKRRNPRQWTRFSPERCGPVVYAVGPASLTVTARKRYDNAG